MAMTYEDFKAYIVDTLWKRNDAQLAANLDNLITQANHDLQRTLKVEERSASAVLPATSQLLPLPSDYHSIRGVAGYGNTLGEFRYMTPSALRALVGQTGAPAWEPVYSIEGRSLLLAGPVPDGQYTVGAVPPASPNEGTIWYRTTISPGLYVWVVDSDSGQWAQVSSATAAADVAALVDTISIIVDYSYKIPDFQFTNASFLTDEYLDLYVYTVAKHAAPFLRDDARLQTWLALQRDALVQANEDAAFNKQRGVYAQKALPRQAGIIRRR